MHFLSSAQMRTWDWRTVERDGIPGAKLMHRAGMMVARIVARMAVLRGTRRIYIVAGRGNNGGDAFVAARFLHQEGFVVKTLLACPSDAVQGDARLAWDAMLAAEVPWRVMKDDTSWATLNDDPFARHAVFVDGLLGTGSHGAPQGAVAAAVRWLAALRHGTIVAVDLPSGLDTDTGEPTEPIVRADRTVTFGAPKTGFANPKAWKFLGHLEVVDIGLPHKGMPNSDLPMQCMDAISLGGLLPRRARDSHKGNYGHVLVIAGSRGLNGAPALAALGALRGGAGLVSAVVPAECLAALAAHAPSAMAHAVATEADVMTRATLAALPKRPEMFDVVVAGPGMTSATGTMEIVEDLLEDTAPRLLLDADALNVFAGRPEALRRKQDPTHASLIITPHPGEAARLLNITVAEVQSKRELVAQELAIKTGAVVVLKGAGTIVCAPGPGHVPHMNFTGNPGMAKGGSGDVLAGLIAALWAQGLTPFDAACLGVYLHGTAGDLAAWKLGERALTAEETAAHIGPAFQWLESVQA